MTVNWQDILNSKPEDAKKPEPTPSGTYLGIITGFEFKESDKKGTPYVSYKIKLISPMEDVNQEALTTFGGLEKLASREQKLDFYMTEDARYRHRDFLEKTLLIPFNGRGWQPVIAETTNKQLKVHIAHVIGGEKKDTIYANIDDHGPAA